MKKSILSLIVIVLSILMSPLYAAESNVIQAANSPPGLHGKGGADFPRGLEKREKEPKGWTKGEKRGWAMHHRHHHRHHRHHHVD